MIKTMDGPIPNLDYYGIECPVKLKTEMRKTRSGRYTYPAIVMQLRNGVGLPEYLPTPLRSAAGTLIYALPGGGQIDSGIK